MAGVNGDRKGKKDDNGIGTAIDFMLSNAKLVLGVGGAAMLGIATLAVKRVSEKPFISNLSPLPCTMKGVKKTTWSCLSIHTNMNNVNTLLCCADV